MKLLRNTFILIAGLLLSTIFLTDSVKGDSTVPLANQSWVKLGGPLGGLGYDIRMRPDNPDVMYVTDANAGVHRSNDGGKTWFSINEGIDLRVGVSGDLIPVFCLTIDPNDYDTIWVGLSGVGGIYRSVDGGFTWQKMTQGIIEDNGLTIRGISIEPGNSDVVYVAGEISSWVWAGEGKQGRMFDKTMGVVYKSLDGGSSWVPIWRGDNLARYIWIDPNSPGVIYVSTGIFDRESANTNVEMNEPGGVGILKSEDGGSNWEVLDMDNGLTGLYVGSLFMHPENSNTLMAGTGHDYWTFPFDQGGVEISHGGVFLTHDGGVTWKRTLDGEGIYSVEYCLSNPEIAYAAGTLSVYRSEDGGSVWHRVSGGHDAGGYWGPPGVVSGFPIDIQCDPRNPDRLFINNYGGGNFLSEDGGVNWIDSSIGYSGSMLFGGLALNPEKPNQLYAAGRSGLFVSQDGGASWSGLNNQPARHAEILFVEANPIDFEAIITSPWDMNRLVISQSGGSEWTVLGEISDFNIRPGTRPIEIEFSTTDPNIAYMAMGRAECKYLDLGACQAEGGGFYKSDDGGYTWSSVNNEWTQFLNPIDLAVNPHEPDIVYGAVGPDGIYKTIDGGEVWTQLPTDCESRSVSIHPTEPNVIFIGCFGGVQKSLDGGETWKKLEAGLIPEGLFVDIVIDPFSPDNIWVADYFSGVYYSADGGQRWEGHNDGLLVKAVTDLAISKDGQTLFAATQGGGVFRLSMLLQDEFDRMAPAESSPTKDVEKSEDLSKSPKSEDDEVQPAETNLGGVKELTLEPAQTRTADDSGIGRFPCVSGIPLVGIAGAVWVWKGRRSFDDP